MSAALPAIEVKDLRKTFLLSDARTSSLKTLFLWWRRIKRRKELREVLKGVSFQVQPGECVAIVGRNGAGKSTLLSLLARVYQPTGGSVTIRGKVAPLLELGAGFHTDLSGRDNVVFNGMLLGLTRKQAEERVDRVIAYAELEDYARAPLRTYSSGMVARLGFSSAIHSEPEILIVDEALAVGDHVFVAKSLGRIRQFKEEGGTILLVSHSANMVLDIADRCVWLEHGEVRMQGDAHEVLSAYMGWEKQEAEAERAQEPVPPPQVSEEAVKGLEAMPALPADDPVRFHNPPEAIQKAYVGPSFEPAYLDARTFANFALEHAFAPDLPERVLDLGCEWGKLTRLLKSVPQLAEVEFHASDTARLPLDAMRRALPGVWLTAHQPMPPTDYRDGTFDVIMSTSLFARTDEDSTVEWGRELARLLRPGGRAVVATQGLKFLQMCEELRGGIRPIQNPRHEKLATLFADPTARLRYERGEHLFEPTHPTLSFRGDAMVPRGWFEDHWAPLGLRLAAWDESYALNRAVFVREP